MKALSLQITKVWKFTQIMNTCKKLWQIIYLSKIRTISKMMGVNVYNINVIPWIFFSICNKPLILWFIKETLNLVYKLCCHFYQQDVWCLIMKIKEFALKESKWEVFHSLNNFKMYKLVVCLWLTLKEKMSYLKVFWYYILTEIIVKICNAIMLLKMGSFLLFTEHVATANTASATYEIIGVLSCHLFLQEALTSRIF